MAGMRWDDGDDYIYDRQVDGESFARVEATVEAMVEVGYREWRVVKRTLYVHDRTGLVTADPGRLVKWLEGVER